MKVGDRLNRLYAHGDGDARTPVNQRTIVNTLLNDVEIRILGSLVEKSVTTPEYYPLSLNALVNACNQLSNREPVVSFDEKTVARALETLREKNLAYVFYGSESRVPKYKHVMAEIFHLGPGEVAVLCVLMLRGAQTVGELRGRTARLFEFGELSDVESALDSLTDRDDGPLVTKLERRPGQKEARFAHLLSGEVTAPVEEAARAPRTPRAEPAVLEVRAENERIAALENEVAALHAELEELKKKFEEFRTQFE